MNLPNALTLFRILLIPVFMTLLLGAVPYGEALAVGRPVVCSDVLPLAGIAIDGKTAYVAPMNDNVAFAEKVVLALTHPAEADIVGRAGREVIRDLADSGLVVSRILNWINSFVQAEDECPGEMRL